jgi:hypothetical protein
VQIGADVLDFMDGGIVHQFIEVSFTSLMDEAEGDSASIIPLVGFDINAGAGVGMVDDLVDGDEHGDLFDVEGVGIALLGESDADEVEFDEIG